MYDSISVTVTAEGSSIDYKSTNNGEFNARCLLSWKHMLHMLQWSMKHHECTRHIAHVPNMVCKFQRKQKSDTKTRQKPLNFILNSKVKVESESWIYATHSFIGIHACKKYGKPMSNKKYSYGLGRKTYQNLCKFDLEVKGQHRIWIMNIRNRFSYGDTHWVDSKTCRKRYKFDLEVNGQHSIGLMKVCDTLSHGDTPICQLWPR